LATPKLRWNSLKRVVPADRVTDDQKRPPIADDIESSLHGAKAICHAFPPHLKRLKPTQQPSARRVTRTGRADLRHPALRLASPQGTRRCSERQAFEAQESAFPIDDFIGESSNAVDPTSGIPAGWRRTRAESGGDAFIARRPLFAASDIATLRPARSGLDGIRLPRQRPKLFIQQLRSECLGDCAEKILAFVR
jgi:hypothetical protein